MRSRIAIIIAGLVLLLTLGIIFLVASNKKEASPQAPEYRKQADAFMNLMTGNQPEPSYKMLSASVKADVSHDDWINQLKDSFGSSKVTASYITSSPVGNKNGYEQGSDPHTVSYATTVKGVKWKTDLLIFKKDNTWVVDSLKSYKQ